MSTLPPPSLNKYFYCIYFLVFESALNLISTFLLLSLGWHLCWWTISTQRYHPPCSQCVSVLTWWLLVPKGISHPVVSVSRPCSQCVSALTWFLDIQSNLSIATIEGSSEKRSHKTGGRWIEVMVFAPKVSRGKTYM